MPKDSLLAKSYLPLNLDDIGKDKQTEENIIAKQELSAPDTFKKSNTSLIDKLKNESSNLKMFEKEKSSISTILTNDQLQSIFKEKESSSNLNDPFFDDPVPSEKTSFFNLQSENAFSLNSFKDNAQNKSNSNNLLGTEKNTLSSLKNLPALTTKSKEWNYNAADLPKSLPSLDTAKLAPVSEKYEEKEIKDDMKEDAAKKELDIESNEESSERQINSDESIEEDLEGDFSVGLEDLLNSSLSLGEDATSDQTVSQISVVDGVDHVEPILN
ncbi:FGFR1 oncogene partner [Caerostris extrusa]|uniref:FGFR1 oncogene partner n=1 Tax=Caerostris extrusa TaxID=172846 RepID=A0AAV4RGY8_CAEEX|nr:FGFR1 oncogene partner [Caerostris extrusa]